MNRIAVIAALPREIAGLVKGIAPERTPRSQGVSVYSLPNALFVAAGMGAERATIAVQAAVEHGGITELISTGLAGSCSLAVPVGSVVSATVVVDARTGERFKTAERNAEHVLVSTDGIASVHEKARLAASYGAAIVDMEAATVARLAEAHGLHFRAVKAVSDAHDFELESLSRFAGRHGAFRTGAFALHTAVRPHRWRQTVRLGRNSTRALAALAENLRSILAG